LDRKAFETKLNVLVGRLLNKDLGLKAISESISFHKRPDVMVFVNGVKVVVEGSYSKRDAESDVIKRLEEGLADLGIALHYKEDFPSDITDSELEERLKTSVFEVRIIVPEDISETLIAYFKGQKVLAECVTKWMEIKTIAELPPIINDAVQFILKEKEVEQIISKIEGRINEFVLNARSIDPTKQVAKNLYDIFYKLYGLSVGNYEEIDELIYAKAALALLLSEAFYQSIHAQVGLKDLTYLTRSYGYRLGISKAFEEILRIDYKPIYRIALQVINVLPDALSLSLKKLTDLAVEISSKRTLLSRDFAGKVYHKIVGDWSVRKGFATYFTTVPAAYLLAYLAIFTRTGVFSEFGRVKIGDITCGSGTLLTASYNALKDLYVQSRFRLGEEVNLEDFHKMMLEECLWGLDALMYAVQIASTNLAFQNPTVQVNKMNTFAIPLGIENGRVILGSLEFMKGRALPPISAYFAEQFAGYPFMEGVKSASITESEEIPSEIPEFDLIIMNPPFTRATGRGGREKGGLFGFIVEESSRKRVVGEYNKLRDFVQKQLEVIAQKYYGKNWFGRLGIGKEPFSIGQAGEGLPFLYLASKLVKDGGKIAFVLPKSLLTGISWFLARCLLLDKFHLEHVVVSYDADKGYNFSESTSLSETLIVARKREQEKERADEREETTITVLLSKPSTSLEARALALKVLKATNNGYLEVNGAKGYVYKVQRRKLIERLHNWGSLLPFPDPELTRVCDEILSGNLFGVNIPMVRLGEIATIGIDRHQFHDAFEKVGGRPSGSYPAIYGGEEERRLYMLTEPNARILPKAIKTKKGEKLGDKLFKEFSSNLLIPDRIRVNTTHVIGMYCNEPVLSNIFYALRIKKNLTKRLKALCLWFNTTWGILSILANRAETEGGWINLKMTHWRLQPVLDVTRLSEEVIEALVRTFDEHCRREFKRLPEQFNPENIDSARLSLDKEFIKSLGIMDREEEIKELYKLIYENISGWIGES